MDQKKPQALINDLKSSKFSRSYLLYGEEQFLVSFYAKAIEKAAFPHGVDPLCRDTFDGKVSAHDIIMAAETVPFLSEYRFVLVRDSGLFDTGQKENSAAIAAFLEKIPDTTIIVFAESKIDRRSKLFKEIAKVGVAVDCTPPTPNELSTWVTRLAKEKGKKIAPPVAQLLVRTVGTNMWMLFTEMEKLAAFIGNGEEIATGDIEAICTPTLESKIFDLTKAMFGGRTSVALSKYNDMLLLKESPIGILTMIIRQFRIILVSKCAKETGMTIGQIAAEFKLHDFAVSEALGFGSKFTTEMLIAALEECLELDVKIKTGLITPELGVELLIVKYGMKPIHSHV